jgi:hypothetical protein
MKVKVKTKCWRVTFVSNKSNITAFATKFELSLKNTTR